MSRFKKSAIVGLSIICFILGIVGLSYVLSGSSSAPSENVEETVAQDFDERATPPAELFDSTSIQSVVDVYVGDAPGTYSVVVQDPMTGKVIAEHQSNTLYFSASLYKLYMAFIAHQDIGSGVFESGQAAQGSRTLIDCLDVMIRESDSPCGEAVLALYDYAVAQDRLRQLGLPNINMPGFQVSAADMTALLQRIYSANGISPEAEVSMRDAMLDQIYIKGLKAGFSSSSVENKVGFSAGGDWHDVGIVTLQDGRQVIVAVLSNGAGSAGVSGLAARLEQAL